MTKPFIKIAHNAVTAKLYGADREAKLLVSAILSYKVEGAEHMASFKKQHWDGRSSFFQFKADKFPAGFVHAVHDQLKSKGYRVQLVRKPFPKPRGPAHPVVDSFALDSRYEYQPETVGRLLKYGMMVAQVATGGGKSRIAKLAYARIGRPTLFLTTRSVLMHQMKDSFEKDMGLTVGVMGDGEWSPTSGINVGMVQTLAPYAEKKSYAKEIEMFLAAQYEREQKELESLKVRMKRKKSALPAISKALGELRASHVKARPSDTYLAARVKIKVDKHNVRQAKVVKILSIFELVILEEAHEASGEGFFTLMSHLKNAHYRLSLTGTPFMREDEESNMRLMAVSGQVGIKISEKMLIDLEILAKPIFKYIKPVNPNPDRNRAGLFRNSTWQKAYKVGIVENQIRNGHIVDEAVRAAEYGLTSMVLVQHTAHGKTLKEQFRIGGLRAEFIQGKDDQERRKDALQKLESGSIDVLIGSTILDVGVDVPAVGMVILAGGGKAEIALRQRIGRGLRCKKSGPNICLVVDFIDGFNSHLRDHAATRRAIIDSTPGFVEGILPKNQDFDYERLGFVKKAA